MKPITINANDSYFQVIFKNEGSKEYNMRWSGLVAELQQIEENKFLYQSNDSSDFVEDIADARIWFEWSFCWRGVWEGRVYFKDDEYWSCEMKTIPLIWEQIEAIVKDKIKTDNPDYKYFEE